jgi:hypothetical protein
MCPSGVTCLSSGCCFIAEHIIKLLNGEEDDVKVWAEERASNRRVNLCPDAVYRIYVQEVSYH